MRWCSTTPRSFRPSLAACAERDGASAQVSVTLTERLGPNRWQALARPAKRLKPGDRIDFGEGSNVCLLGSLAAKVESRGEEGEVTLAFDLAGPALDEAIHAQGAMPLPPYIASRRAADARDASDYQTIFAREEGAVAAPTAGLHFTERLMQALDASGASPVISSRSMSGPAPSCRSDRPIPRATICMPNAGQVSAETAAALNAVKARGGKIVAVGTTSLRLLESAAGEDGQLSPFDGQTSLFITPGYRFRVVDRLLTNFHLPRSTLFMLVASFSGLDLMKRAYAHAVGERYRFYSYGDACLLSPARDSDG